MDYSENLTVGELLANQADNSDVSLEDIRAILAEEMTIEDIYYRRRMARLEAEREAYQAKIEADAEALKPEYERLHTGTLLRKFRGERAWQFRGLRYDYNGDFVGDGSAEARVIAMRKVLATREHYPAKNKREGKAARRAAAQQHHGSKKLRSRAK